MGYYDITNNIPLELDPIENKRNSEINSFIHGSYDNNK